MILIGSSLALLVIYAGVKLLIQTKREALEHIYKCAAWFFIISGFLMLLCAGACCVAMFCKYGKGVMHKEHKMMSKEHDHYMESHHKMMKHHHRCHEESCNININCCTENNCCETNMQKYCNYHDPCKADSLKCRK